MRRIGAQMGKILTAKDLVNRFEILWRCWCDGNTVGSMVGGAHTTRGDKNGGQCPPYAG